MKKLIILIAAIFIFVGCVPIPESDTPDSNGPIKDNPASPEPSVTGDVITQAITEDAEHYTINLQYPKFEGYDELNAVLKELVETEEEGFRNVVAEFEKDEFMEDVFEEGFGSYIDTNYSVIRNDNKIVSVLFNSHIYEAGAAHPMSYTMTINWDTTNNKEIHWVDVILGDQDIPLILSEMTKPRIYENFEMDPNEVDDWIEEGAGPDPINFESYTIGESEITIYFDPYQIAAYAAGPQAVEIPFEDLGVLLNPELN